MTKDEALKAMEAGKKLTHRYFTDEEWVMMDGNKYLFEDGAKCYPAEFWCPRTDDMWQDGFEIYIS